MSDEAGHAPQVGARRVILVGMMGSGKTTVGRLLGERSGWPYLDNDDLVRQSSGREPSAIRAEDGEAALHELESSALRRALRIPPPVLIGAAAGVVEDPDARADLARDSHVVWLRAQPGTLRERIGSGAGRRTEATDEAWLAQHAEAREPVYRALADQVIDVDTLSPDEVADAIMDQLDARPGR